MGMIVRVNQGVGVWSSSITYQSILPTWKKKVALGLLQHETAAGQ